MFIRLIDACHLFFIQFAMKKKIGFLGCDVSKGYVDCVLLGGDLKQLEIVVQFDDTSNGHDSFCAWLTKCELMHGLTQIDIALESTGGLEDNWYRKLVALGLQRSWRVARLNPSVVKDAAKAELTANGSDAISARNIAMYLVRYAEHVDFRVLDVKYAGFRSLNNRIAMINKQKTQVNNEFKQILYCCFPEILRYCRKGIPKWVLLLLKEYPLPSKLSRARPETVAKIKGITMEKAQSLIALAKRSVASRQTVTDNFLVKEMTKDLLYKDEQLNDLKEYLENECKGEEVTLLQTIVGIGTYSAAVIIVEIEDVARFPSPEKLASYFGLHPIARESGDKKKASRMSKKGRPAIRAALYNCARSAVIFDPYLKALYVKHRANGKGYDQALGVVMHKLLRIIWAVLTKKEVYDPEIDKANQLKKPQSIEEQEINQITAKRREQPFDEAAPISNKAARKRKALETSQSSDARNERDLVRAPAV